MTDVETSYVGGVRVVELSDEQAEYCGRVLAGLGADVIKIEPPAGNATRGIGPFLDNEPGPERSLYFWHYNFGKRSVVLDLESAEGKQQLLDLLATTDVFLESTPKGYLERLGLDHDTLTRRFPALIVARMSPFGDHGPWAGYKGSDLVHLALGGPMMCTGYDPELDGHYDLPPIAPQAWHAYHIAGEQLAIFILGALLYKRETGQGQYLSAAVHEAVAKNTELDIASWIFLRQPLHRQTCRHAFAGISPQTLGATKDGRWVITMPPMGPRFWRDVIKFYDQIGHAGELHAERFDSLNQPRGAAIDPSLTTQVQDAGRRLFSRYAYDRLPVTEAMEAGMVWGPVRKPRENASDPHWRERGTVREVEGDHGGEGRSLTYALGKWASSEGEWRSGPRAPHVGEHTDEVLRSVPSTPVVSSVPAVATPSVRRSRLGKPFALNGIRILDFTWWLASGGGPRFLSALGADSIKVEWKDNLDLRYGHYPVGGREAREKATAPLPADTSTMNRNGWFNDIRAGQRGISLNVRHPEGLAIAKQLIAQADIVAEGFTPGTMESWGLGYDVMKEIKPDLIYVSQSGLGARGLYGKYRIVGPTAASWAGVTEMSGLPDPHPPAGWGYSYLDWFGAYNLATAMMAGLHYRAHTGRGLWIDSSQVEPGIFMTGAAILDWSANGREWARYGNRSPYKEAAPHGAYRVNGTDRWVAIACFSETEWEALTEVAGHPEWREDGRFRTLAARLAHQDDLDALVTSWSLTQGDYDLMHRLQKAGVPAGVCQHAEDRCENDPQLAALNWLTEVDQTEMGRWPVKEIPVHASATPPFMGGPIDRGAPCYGEDNEFVFGELLGVSSAEIRRLAADGVI